MATPSPTRRHHHAERKKPAPKGRRWRLAAAAAVVLLAAVGGTLALSGGADQAAAPQVSPLPGVGPVPFDERVDTGGQPLPDVSFEMFDGQPATFADFRGRPLVINFFASWCTSCLAELPEFHKVYAANQEQVEFLGVSLQDSPEAAARLIDWAGLTYPIAVDPRGQLFGALRAYAMPTTLFVNADGTIAELYGGELTAEQLTDRLHGHQFIPEETASR